MSAPKTTLAKQVHRERREMVTVMSTLANAAEAYKHTAAQLPRQGATAAMRRSIACTRAAETIGVLLLDSGVSVDEAMTVADDLDRESATLAGLASDEEAEA